MSVSTVLTIKRAKEILTDNLEATSFEIASCSCECGETQSVEGYDLDYNYLGKVGVCDSCGDDSAFSEEVLIK